ncbi:MAG: prepilin-type N-terminal cleavage/methylation domain-containing protein [Phycisphaerae bacterium]|nr:prepilin-type N-terminal cleavage/methylation domain-containing protein [Phycisphaerae bacterium]
MTTHPIDKRGFTLLEAVLAIALIGVILAVVHTALWVSQRSYRAARDRAARQTTASAAGHLLADDAARLAGPAPDGPTTLLALPDAGPDAGEGLLRLRLGGRAARGQRATLVDYFYVADDGERGAGALIRRAMPLHRAGDVDAPEGRYEIIADGLRSAGFRFFDGQTWRDAWDTRADGVPRLIELTLVMAGPDGEADMTLRRTVPVAVQAGLLDETGGPP